MTGNVTGTVSDLSNQDTDALSEGTTNLYYTDARAKAAITAGTGVTVSSGEVSIGQAVGTTSDVTFNSVTGNLTGNVTGTVSDLSNQDTDALSEGTTNLYYTDARAKAAITAGTGVTVSSGEVSLTNSSVSLGGVSVDLGGTDATPAFDLSDATSYPTSSLTGTITNAQLAGSIANAKLANSSVSYGGVSVALGATDATPAFDLTDATNYPTSSLDGTITNAQLAGSIANAKLTNSSVSYGVCIC